MAHIGALQLKGGQLVGGEATEQVDSRGKGHVSSPEKSFCAVPKNDPQDWANGKGMIEELADLSRQSEEGQVTIGSIIEGLGWRVCRGRTSQDRTGVVKQETNLPQMYLT